MLILVENDVSVVLNEAALGERAVERSESVLMLQVSQISAEPKI